MIPVLSGHEPIIIETQNHVDIRNAVQFAKDEELNYLIAAPIGAWRVADLLKANGVRVLIGNTQAYPDAEDDPYDSVTGWLRGQSERAEALRRRDGVGQRGDPLGSDEPALEDDRGWQGTAALRVHA